MKKILFFLLFFFYVPLSSANIVNLNNNMPGDAIIYDSIYNGGEILKINKSTTSSPSRYPLIQIYNKDNQLLFTKAGFAGGGTFSSLDSLNVITSITNFGNNIYSINYFSNPTEFPSLDPESIPPNTQGLYAIFFIEVTENSIIDKGIIQSGNFSGSNRPFLFLEKNINDNISYCVGGLQYSNGISGNVNRINCFDTITHNFYTKPNILPGGVVLDYISQKEIIFKNGVLMTKWFINNLYFFGVNQNTGFTQLITEFFPTSTFTDSRIFINDVGVTQNYIKALISVTGINKTFLLEIDIQNQTYEIGDEINEFLISKDLNNYYLASLSGLNNIKSNKSFIWLGKIKINDNFFITYFEENLNSWVFVDDNQKLIILNEENFLGLFGDIGNVIPPVAGPCGFLDIRCYFVSIWDYIYNTAFGPVTSLIENIKTFISKFSEFFTTEVRDFSFLPTANASFTNTLNNTSIENAPSFVKGVNNLGKGIAYLFLIIAGLLVFILIMNKKNGDSN